MEVTIMDAHTPYSGKKKQTGAIGFTLVSELPGTILADFDEEILVEVESQGFVYDEGTGLETGTTLTLFRKKGSSLDKCLIRKFL